jgi:phage tail P2-like protein
VAYDPTINQPEDLWGEPTSLLPHNETQLDNAQELTDAGRYPLPFGDPIRAKDPYSCPPQLLPYLAWERSTDVWNPKWPIERKRVAVADAFVLQRMKGTEAGLRAYVAAAGGVADIVAAPPILAFLGREMTAAERIQWLSQFKQLRSFPFTITGQNQFVTYNTRRKIVAFSGTFNPSGIAPVPVGSVQTVSGFYPPPNRQCCARLDMSKYAGNRTFLFDPKTGISEPVLETIIEAFDASGKAQQYHQVVLPTSLGTQWFAGQWPMLKDKIFFINGRVGYYTVDTKKLIATRIVTMLQQSAPLLNGAGPVPVDLLTRAVFARAINQRETAEPDIGPLVPPSPHLISLLIIGIQSREAFGIPSISVAGTGGQFDFSKAVNSGLIPLMYGI